jgi:hypothetical protein
MRFFHPDYRQLIGIRWHLPQNAKPGTFAPNKVMRFSRGRAIEIRERLRTINEHLKPKNVKRHGNDVKALEAERQRLLDELPPNLREKIIEKETTQKIQGDAAKEGNAGAARGVGTRVGELEKEIDKIIGELQP